MVTTKNIFLIGPMGAGKTSIGRELAKKLKLEFYDTDQVIEERSGADIPWIFDIEGEEGYRSREAKIIAELTKLQGIVLATGGGAVATPENRNNLAARGIVIYLKTSLEDQMVRTSKSKKRPLSREEAARQKTLQHLRQECESLYKELADFTYDTDKHSVRFVAQKIIKDLKKENYI
jgi:shikimate kinase